MFHMIGQVTLKQYGCLICSSGTMVAINHLQTLTGGVTLTHFYYYIDFSKQLIEFSKYNLTDFLSLNQTFAGLVRQSNSY